MKKIKIGVLTEIINYHSGARAPLEIAKQLALFGHTVTIFAYDTMFDQSSMNELKTDNLNIKLFNKKNIPFIGKYVSAFSLYKLLRHDPPSAMWYSGTLPFFLAAKITGIPIIRMYQGTQFDALLESKLPNDKQTLTDKILNTLANIFIYVNDFIAYKLSKSVVAISEYAAQEGENLYKRKCNAVIYHGTSNLPQTEKKTLQKKDYIEIISVSRITPYKGFHLILQAIKKILPRNTVKLTIAGSQPKMRYITYLKKLGGKNLEIIIDPSDTELANYYQRSDFCVTADRFLYFGLSIYEAAFFGKPTVALNQAAAAEVIDHGKTGFVAQTSLELTKYMQQLINDPILLKRLGENARKKAMNFTWKKCAREWEKAITDVISYNGKGE